MYFLILSAPVYRYWVSISVTIALDFRKLLFSCTLFLSLRHMTSSFLTPVTPVRWNLVCRLSQRWGSSFWSPMQICFTNVEYSLSWQHCLVIVQQKSIYTIIVLYNLCMKKLQLLIFHNIFKILEDMLSFMLRLKTSLSLRLQTGIYRCGDQTCFHRKLQQGCLTEMYLKNWWWGLCLYDLNQFM